MSVVVRMEMPKNCYNCDLRYECDAFYAPGKPKPFMKGCRIICQLPEGHGRLVDADKEIDFHVNDFERLTAEDIDVYSNAYSLSDLCDGITYAYDHADIIVPAEENT